LLWCAAGPAQEGHQEEHVSSNFMGSAFVAGALAALLLGCGESEPSQPAYREAYADSVAQVQEGLESGDCQVTRTCGELSFVDCGQDVDGPAYYVNLKLSRVLEICGGACLGGPGVNGWCVACPPPEWTCTP